MRCACFARGWRSQATAANLGCRAIVYDTLHQAHHQVGNTGVQHVSRRARALPHNPIGRILYRGDKAWRNVITAIGKHGVGAGHLERGGHVGAQGESRGGQHVPVKAGCHR